MAQRSRWWAKVLLYGVLEFGALLGIPIRPRDIEAMTRQMNDTLVAEVLKGEREGEGEPPRPD